MLPRPVSGFAIERGSGMSERVDIGGGIDYKPVSCSQIKIRIC